VRIPANRVAATTAVLLTLAFAIGAATRITGLFRGAEPSWQVGESGLAEAAFFHFHPDEDKVLDAALTLASPFAPPMTAYGSLTFYLVRAAVEAASAVLGFDPHARSVPAAVASTYWAVRALAAAVSIASLWLVWLIGSRWFSPRSALLATFLLAVSAAAIQQAHFMTVDGLFVLACLGAFYFLGRSLETQGQMRHHLLTGLFIGAAAAVRLNGLLLLAGVAVGHLTAARGRPGGWFAAVTGVGSRSVLLSGLAAAAVLLVLQPFMVTDFDALLRGSSVDSFAFAIRIARGEVLRSWTLADVGTAPYFHHWTHLMPLAVGWPLTVASLVGIGVAVRRPQPLTAAMLVWCALYFALIGGLHTKYVRYLLPFLPFLILMAADAVTRLAASRSRAWRWLGSGSIAVIVLYTGAYGVGVSRLYLYPDSRIEAARWIRDNVPEGSAIGIERGGFSMRSVIDPKRYHTRVLNTSVLFEARGYATCGAALTYLEGRIAGLDYIAITDVNRYRQFTAAPELVPAAARFYRQLVAGELDFELVARFKRYPSILGYAFVDDEAEPSFLAYEHPAVFVLSRRPGAEVAAALDAWRADLDREQPHCADSILRQAVASVRDGEQAAATTLLKRAQKEYPAAHIARYMLDALQSERGAGDPLVLQRLWDGYSDRQQHVMPWAVGLSLTDLGVPGLALAVLRQGAVQSTHLPLWARRDMAGAYAQLGDVMSQRSFYDPARQVYELSAGMRASAEVYNKLVNLALGAGDYPLAVGFAEKSLAVDGDQPAVHTLLGRLGRRP
jgi:tetratricopeptide (TPR) repeat protein